MAGRRRLAAARNAGLELLPCVLRNLSDDEAADAALAENMHRRQLSPVEQALAFDRLRKKGLTQAAIGQRVGRSDSTVSILLRLLEMPEPIREKVHTGRMSYMTAYEHWKRDKSGRRQGGSKPPRPMSEDDAKIVFHWRRRHDRLVGGLHAIRRARASTVYEVLTMVERLIKIDMEPLDEATR